MMNGTGSDHPLVHEYLRELNAALHSLPPRQASELKEQISAHLDDALPPGADAEHVAETLGQLGSPADLVAEAKGSIPTDTPTTLGGTFRTRLARVRRRTWIIAGVTALGIATVATYLTVLLSGTLQLAGQFAWWYPQDYLHQVDTQTYGGAQQTAVHIRSGHLQGFAVGIYNPTNWTQTIVGPATGPNSPNVTGRAHFGVSVFNRDVDRGGFVRDIRFSLPGSIPPHQIRLLRITWISTVCLMEKGDSIGINALNLRVRTGWVTRTEVIPLDQGVFLLGPSHGRPTSAGCL